LALGPSDINARGAIVGVAEFVGIIEGASLGCSVGDDVGASLGTLDLIIEGISVVTVGQSLAMMEGETESSSTGLVVGSREGVVDGSLDCSTDGSSDGFSVGLAEELVLATAIGLDDGKSLPLGRPVGACVSPLVCGLVGSDVMGSMVTGTPVGSLDGELL